MRLRRSRPPGTRRRSDRRRRSRRLVVIDAPIERVWAVAGRHRGPAALDARHEVRPRLTTPRPVGVGTRGEADGPDLRDRRSTDPVTITEFEPPHPVRDQPRGDVQRRRRHHPRAGRGRHDHDRPLGGAPRRPSSPISADADAGLRTIFQADLDRLRDLVEPARPEPTRPCTPPRRRHLRAVPGALRAAAAGPRARRHHPVGRLRACATSCCTCCARRARRTSAAPRTGSSSRSATTSIPGYKSSAGMPPELLAQFPIAEAAVEALGIVLWPMVEFEADDAIAAAAVRFAEDPRVERILVCTPDKDMAQLVARRADRALGPPARPRPTTTPASAPSGACAPTSIPDWLGARRRLVGRLPGPARLGRQVGGRGPRAGTATSRTIPPKASAWEVPGVGGTRAMALAATLRDHWDEALLYRDLARLRTAEDGVPIRQRDPEELRWDGAPRAAWEAFCEEWGLERLRDRPHRWLDDADARHRPRGGVLPPSPDSPPSPIRAPSVCMREAAHLGAEHRAGCPTDRRRLDARPSIRTIASPTRGVTSARATRSTPGAIGRDARRCRRGEVASDRRRGASSADRRRTGSIETASPACQVRHGRSPAAIQRRRREGAKPSVDPARSRRGPSSADGRTARSARQRARTALAELDRGRRSRSVAGRGAPAWRRPVAGHARADGRAAAARACHRDPASHAARRRTSGAATVIERASRYRTRSSSACVMRRPAPPGSRSTSACATSNHGPPSIAVTAAPPRSAISPAAATSQADSPPCWMNASNRPLRHVGQGQRRRAHRARDADRLADVPGPRRRPCGR